MLAISWKAPHLVIYLPVVLLAGITFFVLFSRPLANLCGVLMGFVALTDYEAGIQVLEVIYGMYFISFLVYWFLRRLFIEKKQLISSFEDRTILLLLILVTCYLPISFLFNGYPQGIFSEWIAFTLLAFYFPVKEAIKEHEHGAKIVLLSILVIGLFVGIRNMIFYQGVLSNATQAWQVAKGRVATNDNLLMVTSIYALVLFTYARSLKTQTFFLSTFLLFFTGLILTQSRAYWIAFVFGAFVMFLWVGRQQKRRILLITLTGLASVLLIGFIFLQDLFFLIFGGIIDRLLTLQTATTADISLVNRFRETAAAWAQVVKNPILGYGMGVPYVFFDIAHGSTDVDAFIHNGYLSLWYKYGILGLGLMLVFWFGSIRKGYKAFKTASASYEVRITGLIASSTLIAFMLTTITSNPFFLNDTLFIFALLTGMAAGAHERAKNTAIEY